MRTSFRLFLTFLLTLMAWLPIGASAQSACTTVWGLSSDGFLRYLNTTTGQWSASLLTGTGTPNALAGSSSTNLLYYVDRATRTLYSVDPNVNPLASTSVGIIPLPPAPANGANSILGATTNAAGSLFVYATDGIVGTPSFVTVAQISVSTAATLTAWTQIVTTTGGAANLASSGDSFIDAGGTNWIISNTNPPTLHQLDLNAGASFARTNSPALTLSGINGMGVRGVSTDPLTGKTYLGGFNGSTVAPYTSITFQVDLVSGTTTILTQADTSFRNEDMGNCTIKPALPTISKSFTPTFNATAPATTTLLITIGNINTAPIYLNGTLTDNLPAGMLVGPIPALQGSCVAAGNTITATAAANNATFASGGRIPAGGCTISFVVRVTTTGSFVNTIPAGSLTTTAGTNAVAAQAQFQVAVNDFSIDKLQQSGTAGTPSNVPISVAGGSTVQYVLKVTNGAGSVSAGTVTFTDTVPVLITPIFSIVAATSGGGTCVTTTAVVGGQTRVTGTYTAAPLGAVCTVTITGRASVTNVVTSFPNTATLAPVAPSTDGNATNNSSTVTTSILPSTTLTVAKTDGKLTATSGSINLYTVTVANLGPAAADGTLVKDPPSAGLNCTAATCTVTGGAACPGAPLSMAAFQNTGIPISPFPSGSTATFVLTCQVTATGQ